VSCNEAALRIFGVSLAGYNALISAALAALSYFAARKSD
jgi:disulfide bond formation protein DsbB